MDKNQTIGLLLISGLLLVYLYYFSPQPTDPPAQNADSTQVVAPVDQNQIVSEEKPVDTIASVVPDSLVNLQNQQKFGAFSGSVVGNEEEVISENDDIKITYSTKGGIVKAVELKKHHTYDKKPLILLDEESSQMELVVSAKAKLVDLNQLYYSHQTQSVGDTTVVTFSMNLGAGKAVQKIYKLPASGYQLIHAIKFDGLNSDIDAQDVLFTWRDKLKRLEEHFGGYHGARGKSTLNYYTSTGDFDGLDAGSEEIQQKNVLESLDWFVMKQKFFSAGIIAENGFRAADFSMSYNSNDSSVIKDITAIARIPADHFSNDKANYKFYFGPNNYQIVKKVTKGFSQNVDMGWSLFAWINKFVIIPIFNFLENYISNYGIIIIVLVLLIKLVLSPLSYKSYVSMAKTKVLKPELDELKAKHGNDMQKIQQEQMKLYQQVGVNPLSGCIPVLLQMPILLAMFNFFPNSVELRQESFLWANDLSTFDNVLTLPFNLPFYGSHVSLFTLLMTVSTILYTWSNNQMTAVQGPMKSIGYIMPVTFMFVLNSYPAGLTFYYFVSNIVTFAQQTIIRRFVNEEKVQKILDENRKKNKNKKKSKFQQKIEEAMKASEEAKRKK